MVLGAVGAIGVGLLGFVGMLALGGGKPAPNLTLSQQIQAYGVMAVPGQAGPRRDDAPTTAFAGQARQAAEKALANNKNLEARIARGLEAAGVACDRRSGCSPCGDAVSSAGSSGCCSARATSCSASWSSSSPGRPVALPEDQGQHRLKAFSTGLADTLQLMSGSLSAGLSLAQSIDTIVREGNEPIAGEFRRVVIETRLGVTLEDSLDGVAERMESRDFEWVVMAIRIQREVGGNLAELLLTVAATLREREYLRRHVRALSAEGRLSCYILGGLPPGFLVYLTLTKPDYVKPAVHHAARVDPPRRHGRAARRRHVLDVQGREGGRVMSPIVLVAFVLIFVALLLVFGAVGGITKEQRRRRPVPGRARGPHRAPEEMRASSTSASPTGCCSRCWPHPGASAAAHPEDASERIREKLELAGNPLGWTVERVMAGKVVGFAAALVVSLVRRAAAGPRLPAHARASSSSPRWPATWRRTCTSTSRPTTAPSSCSGRCPDAIDLLTISVESGLGFDAACAQVARNTDGPLADEFARMLQEMQIGRGRSEALRSLGDRTNLPDLRSFVSAMVQADAFGIPVGQVLRVQSSEIRVKRRQWAEEMAQKVPVKILVPLIFCILPCLFIAVLGPAGIQIMDSFSGKL